MGKDFYENSELAKEIFDTATAELGLDMTKLCFEENEQLDQTEYTQAAMVTACLAMTAEIEKRGLTPDVTAGLSLGEYCAISAAGGMQPERRHFSCEKKRDSDAEYRSRQVKEPWRQSWDWMEKRLKK